MAWMIKTEAVFIIKASLLYCALAAVFSLLGIFFAEKGNMPHQNPFLALNAQEIGGHALWGLAAGTVTASLRYTILSGAFAVLIDSDHLIGLAHIDSISRMGHSIAFGVIAIVVMLALFGKRSYVLASIAFAAVLSHMSFDIFGSDDGQFPLFTPFYNKMIHFPNVDWLPFEIAAIVIVGITYMLIKTGSNKPSTKLDPYKNSQQ